MQSDRINILLALSSKKFKQLIGVSKNTFFLMLTILETAYAQQHSQGGKPSRITVAERLLITLQYHREYRTMEHIALDFGVVVSRVYSIIVWVEDVLAADSRFTLPGKKTLNDNDTHTIVIDVTEQQIVRPKKNSKNGIPVRKSVTL